VLPEAYSLRLVPYFQDAPTPAQQFTVDGHVSVTVNARKTTSRIVMHALFLQIHSVNVTQVKISVILVGIIEIYLLFFRRVKFSYMALMPKKNSKCYEIWLQITYRF
jgi:Peptidase M1 N-terminal domain